jgi:hypothetical protein
MHKLDTLILFRSSTTKEYGWISQAAVETLRKLSSKLQRMEGMEQG